MNELFENDLLSSINIDSELFSHIKLLFALNIFDKKDNGVRIKKKIKIKIIFGKKFPSKRESLSQKDSINVEILLEIKHVKQIIIKK